MITRIAIVALLIFNCYSSEAQVREQKDYFLPGAGVKFYYPKNSEELGRYRGITGEYVFYARSKNSESDWSGPSRLRSYLNFSVMQSVDDVSDDMFHFNTGITTSFEGKADRLDFIPYYGIQAGGVFQNDFSSPTITPLFGVHFFSTEQFFLNIDAGYLFATKRSAYDGLVLSATLNIVLWRK